MAVLTNDEYRVWQLDTRNDPYRIFLAEVDYDTESSGIQTIRLASAAFIDELYNPYDDWIIQIPYIEEGMGRFDSLGQLTAINPLAVKSYTPYVATYSDNAPTISSPIQTSILDATTIVFTIDKNDDVSSTLQNNEARLIVGTTKNGTDVYDSGYVSFGVDDHIDFTVTGIPINGELVHAAAVMVLLDGNSDPVTVERYYEYRSENVDSWQGKKFYAQECRWLVGDVRWPIADFKITARTLLEGILPNDGKTFNFGLVSPAAMLDIPFTDTAEALQTMTSGAAANYALGLAGFPDAEWVDAPSWKDSTDLEFEIEADHNLLTFLKTIAASMFCEIRINPQTKVVEFYEMVYNPNLVAYLALIDQDDVAYGKIKQIETQDPYKKIDLNYRVGTVTATPSGVPSTLSKTLTVDTYLKFTNNANSILAQYEQFYGVPREIWEIALFAVQDILQVGMKAQIDHTDIQSTGIISNIRREPLSRYSIVEVLI